MADDSGNYTVVGKKNVYGKGRITYFVVRSRPDEEGVPMEVAYDLRKRRQIVEFPDTAAPGARFENAI